MTLETEALASPPLVQPGLAQRARAALLARPFVRNVLLLSGGTALGQASGVLAAPILTRLYSPAEFGAFGIFVALASILAVVAALRYEMAVPLPKSDKVAAHLVLLCLLFASATSVATLAAALVGGAWVARQLNAPGLAPYLWLVPVSLLGAGIYQALQAWAVRRRDYTRIAGTKIVQGLGQTIAQVLFGLAGLGVAGLCAGDAIGRVAGSGRLGSQAWRRDAHLIKGVRPRDLWDAGRRYIRFPIVSSGSVLLNSLGLYLPSLVLAAAYGVEVAGWFALGQRLIGIPMGLVGKSVSNVYLAEASRYARDEPGRLRSLLRGTTRSLLLMGLVPFSLLALVGGRVFGFGFGAEWYEAGVYVQILALAYLAHFVVVPVSQTLNIIERQDLQLAWDVTRFVAVSLALVSAVRYELDARVAIVLYSAVLLVSYLVLLAVTMWAVRRPLRGGGGMPDREPGRSRAPGGELK